MSFDFFPNEQSASMLNAARHPSTTPDAGIWSGFGTGTGQYAMRSLAEAGRAVSMAGAVVPMVADKLVGDDNFSGTTLTDQYFKAHDDIFNNAVDYWTPRPGEVGTAGQIAGQLAGGILQAAISPALLVGTAHLSGAEDLVREGVDAGTANAVGAVQGVGAAVGLKLPFLGKNLATRVLSGGAGNLVQGTAGALAASEVLKSEGYTDEAQRFNPWDVRARVLDLMLGAAFGGMAHLESKGAPKLTPTDESALLVANQARHMEDSTPQGRPATDVDATLHADAMRQAVEQTLRGEPVTVNALTRDMHLVPDETLYQQRAEVTDEAHRIASEMDPSGEPIGTPMGDKSMLADPAAIDLHPAALRARQLAQEQPELTIPTDHFDSDGNPINLKASEALALANADVANAQSTAAGLFKTAAHCLLGAL